MHRGVNVEIDAKWMLAEAEESLKNALDGKGGFEGWFRWKNDHWTRWTALELAEEETK